MKDRFGLETRGTPRAVAALEQALEALFAMRPEAMGFLKTAASDPECALGRMLGAYLGLMSSERGPGGAGVARMGQIAPADDREAAHLSVIRAWAAGDWAGASRRLDDLLEAWPADPIALNAGHQLDFFLGDAARLRSRPARALEAWDPADPAWPYLFGLQAFGLEELGDYPAAEAAAQRALEAAPDDVWAQHALVHALEMQGRSQAGLDLLEARRADWAHDHFLKVHTSWHAALFALETDGAERALALHDAAVWDGGPDPLAMTLIDSAGLLWRLKLDGVEAGGRWDRLSEEWALRDEGAWYAFNDLHAVLAHCGAGRLERARALVDRMAAAAANPDPAATNAQALRSAGLPAARGVLAFAEGDFAACVAWLAPVRRLLSVFGGSHAQRDAWQRTLLVAALRSGQAGFARVLVEERLAERPESPWSQARLAEVDALSR
jgi:tetratricopeptide (TPR) repeat protein